MNIQEKILEVYKQQSVNAIHGIQFATISGQIGREHNNQLVQNLQEMMRSGLLKIKTKISGTTYFLTEKGFEEIMPAKPVDAVK